MERDTLRRLSGLTEVLRECEEKLKKCKSATKLYELEVRVHAFLDDMELRSNDPFEFKVKYRLLEGMPSRILKKIAKLEKLAESREGLKKTAYLKKKLARQNDQMALTLALTSLTKQLAKAQNPEQGDLGTFKISEEVKNQRAFNAVDMEDIKASAEAYAAGIKDPEDIKKALQTKSSAYSGSIELLCQPEVVEEFDIPTEPPPSAEAAEDLDQEPLSILHTAMPKKLISEQVKFTIPGIDAPKSEAEE